jgi:hypothetical protein
MRWLGRLGLGLRMASSDPRMVDDGASGDLVDPRPEPLVVAQRREATLDAEEDLLNDIIHVGLAYPLRHERTQLRLERAPGSVTR